MNIDNILKLLKSSNEDDILLGYTILIKEYSFDEINSMLINGKEIGYEIGKGWDSQGEYIRIYHWKNNSNWIKID